MTPAPELLDCLAALDLDWESLRRDTAGVILFGSRAAGAARADSDWDLLCVGAGSQRLTRRLDMIWVGRARACSREQDWIGSELANHVARFGRVLFGERPWAEDHGRQELAIARKRRQICGHVRGLSSVWPRLNAVYRQRQLGQLRRDLQRLELLDVGEVVPPTAMLDRMCCEGVDPEQYVLEALDRAGLGSATLDRQLAAEPAGS
ncbi:nucleotidyltransferase domain-containing protein [Pseudenhygromyxa sp. WMMC2535]|uniref:nucleotidyltransferase domain-containing protein n=1 Tax=Pseudenhygromyxa sp. WMMC2535 TaxID=2712867 RepID=UPI00159621B7|nr:nucleotidyltransferase domain-containing protein [Pseudenhygromyxa sp. WMMC2535]NVB37214.1 nucleotidyltransferase domain-containing protein [Pseudenhygromyxa sp. WMMC2535]